MDVVAVDGVPVPLSVMLVVSGLALGVVRFTSRHPAP